MSKSLSNTHNPVNVEEAQHLNHFRHLLIRGMSGFVISPLWEKLILQAIHDEPAVCHAAVAFSALQLSNYSSQPLSKTNLQVFALHQYATSVRAFNNLLLRRSLRSIEASLMCSIICICFELLEGSPILAQRHLENSLQVVSSFNVDLDLSRAFARFDVQASTYLNGRATIITLKTVPAGARLFLDLKSAEDSLYQDLNYLWKIYYGIYNSAQYEPDLIPPFVSSELQALREGLCNWREAFQSFENKHQICATQQEVQHASLLRIHNYTATVLLAELLHPNQTIFDAFDDTFQSIVHLSDRLLEYKLGSPWADTFSVEFGVVQPLYITAIKCRIPQVRARAIKLLLAVPQQEGIWNGLVMGKIAEQVKIMEEGDLDTQYLETERLPELCRVHSVGSDINHKDRTASFSCKLRRAGGVGEWEFRTGIVTW